MPSLQSQLRSLLEGLAEHTDRLWDVAKLICGCRRREELDANLKLLTSGRIGKLRAFVEEYYPHQGADVADSDHEIEHALVQCTDHVGSVIDLLARLERFAISIQEALNADSFVETLPAMESILSEMRTTSPQKPRMRCADPTAQVAGSYELEAEFVLLTDELLRIEWGVDGVWRKLHVVAGNWMAILPEQLYTGLEG